MAKKTNPVQQVASTVPLVPLPCKSPQCKICNDERADDILRDKLCKATDVALGQKYYPNDTPHTIENALSVHWNNHVPWEDAANLMPLVRGRITGQPVAVSTQRIFDEAIKTKIDAQIVLERMMASLMERFNLLDDEFLSYHLLKKCDRCGRGPGDATQNANQAKVLDVLESIRRMTVDYLKIKNPRATIKFYFDDTFGKFCRNMMAFYRETLQEKSRLIRYAVNEYFEGKITQPLLLRRIAEVEDLGSNTIAERGILEMREVQAYLDKELGGKAPKDK